MAAYYNEIDPFAAEWLRWLIAEGHIADGDVDTRSIEDVHPHELRGFSQCHFFAGIGVWSAALRDAGWPDDRPVWTGSCPCQPFSAAGKGGGFADERHLWPAWWWLAQQHRPEFIFGEQVASPAGLAWFDLVSSDLEAAGYAVGAADLCAAGVGAPHIRQRLWWVAHGVADSSSTRLEGGDARAMGPERPPAERGGEAGWVQHPEGNGRIERRAEPEWGSPAREGRASGERLGHSDVGQSDEHPLLWARPDDPNEAARASRDGGPWSDVDWIACRDGKWRPVEPGTFPLAHGVTGRVGALRGYGNSIVLPLASAFIQEVMRAALACP